MSYQNLQTVEKCGGDKDGGALKSGKEADVYVVRLGAETCAAKIYKEAQKRSFRQDMRQRLREARGSDPELILLIILALIIPPLAMFIYEGSITTRFWISLVLTLLGAGLIIGWSPLGLLPAIVYTLYVILTGA